MPSGEGDAGREVRKGREGRSSAPSRKRRHPVRVAVVSVVIVVVLLVGAAAGGFAWLRWFSEDDAADFAGTWYLAGTATPITITEDRIQLTDDVSYRYALNDQDKTFELSFGNLKGGGRYRFSLDRNQLAQVAFHMMHRLANHKFTSNQLLTLSCGYHTSYNFAYDHMSLRFSLYPLLGMPETASPKEEYYLIMVTVLPVAILAAFASSVSICISSVKLSSTRILT